MKEERWQYLVYDEQGNEHLKDELHIDDILIRLIQFSEYE